MRTEPRSLVAGEVAGRVWGELAPIWGAVASELQKDPRLCDLADAVWLLIQVSPCVARVILTQAEGPALEVARLDPGLLPGGGAALVGALEDFVAGMLSTAEARAEGSAEVLARIAMARSSGGLFITAVPSTGALTVNLAIPGKELAEAVGIGGIAVPMTVH